jgi:hypothetical protein
MSVPTVTPTTFDTDLSSLLQTSHQKQHLATVLWKQVFASSVGVGCALFISHRHFSPFLRGAVGASSFTVLLYTLNALINSHHDDGLEEKRHLAQLLLDCRKNHRDDWEQWQEVFIKYASNVTSLKLTVGLEPQSTTNLHWTLEGFPNLHSLHLENAAPLDQQTLTLLSKMNKLQVLELKVLLSQPTISTLASLPSLKELTLIDAGACSTDSLMQLTAFPHLKVLSFVCTDEKSRTALSWIQSDVRTTIDQLRKNNFQLFIQDSEHSRLQICNADELSAESIFYCLQFKRDVV